MMVVYPLIMMDGHLLLLLIAVHAGSEPLNPLKWWMVNENSVVSPSADRFRPTSSLFSGFTVPRLALGFLGVPVERAG